MHFTKDFFVSFDLTNNLWVSNCTSSCELTLHVNLGVQLSVGALFLLLAIDVRVLVLEVRDASLGHVAAVTDGNVREGLVEGNEG